MRNCTLPILAATSAHSLDRRNMCPTYRVPVRRVLGARHRQSFLANWARHMSSTIELTLQRCQPRMCCQCTALLVPHMQLIETPSTTEWLQRALALGSLGAARLYRHRDWGPRNDTPSCTDETTTKGAIQPSQHWRVMPTAAIASAKCQTKTVDWHELISAITWPQLSQTSGTNLYGS